MTDRIVRLQGCPDDYADDDPIPFGIRPDRVVYLTETTHGWGASARAATWLFGEQNARLGKVFGTMAETAKALGLEYAEAADA